MSARRASSRGTKRSRSSSERGGEADELNVSASNTNNLDYYLAPGIVIESDFDGYFERIVKNLVNEVLADNKRFKHLNIVVAAGPWRPYDVRWDSEGDVLKIDFYSACRWKQMDLAEELRGKL